MAPSTSASPVPPSTSSSHRIRNVRPDTQGTTSATGRASPPADQDASLSTFLDSSRSSISSDSGAVPNGAPKVKAIPLLSSTTTNGVSRRAPPYALPTSDALKKTPKERLQALLASSSPPSSGPPSPGIPATPASAPSRRAMQANSPAQHSPSPSSHDSSTSRSSPNSITGAQAVTPRPPTSTLPNPAPRKHDSLDSTMSSRSSDASAPIGQSSAFAVQTGKSSLDYSPSGDLEPATLISASGSPEAAIRRLLKDKKTLGTRNEQLWKLVEKQRAMILGLNKDLDKLVKEREMHRAKWKDQKMALDSQEEVLTNYPSSVRSDAREMSQKARTGPSAVAPAGAKGDLQPDVETAPKLKSAHVPSSLRLVDEDHPSPETPPINAVSPAMNSPGESRRKAPPKPLNIDSTASGSRSIPPTVDSEAEATTPEERGRLKTIEDDDRKRAASYVAQEEARSNSKREKSKSKSKPPAGTEQSGMSVEPEKATQVELTSGIGNGIGLPTSPRGPLLGGLQSPLQQSGVGSIGGMLTKQVVSTNAPQFATFTALKSPGLPMSPRPGDRPMNAPLPRAVQMVAAPLMSPGPMSARGGMLSPRPPRQPILLPSEVRTSSDSHSSRFDSQGQQEMSLSERIHKPPASPRSPNFRDLGGVGPVYQGFASGEYAGLLLPPNALGLVSVKVYSSRLRPSRQSAHSKGSEDDSIFTLAVHARADGKQLWRLEKTLHNVSSLDSGLRNIPGFPARLPDKSLFSGHAPAKVDQRRAALNQYFAVVLDSSLPEGWVLQVCSFLSTDVIGPKLDYSHSPSHGEFDRSKKEGFLSKKGKSFGGWKSRYFVLDRLDLQYYEAPGGPHLGTIRLHRAQVGPQNTGTSGEESEYRHALMILEHKRDDSSSTNRHVLCSESDVDRDEWIQALQMHVEGVQEKHSPSAMSNSPKQSPRQTTLRRTKQPTPLASVQDQSLKLQTVGYDQAVQAEPPKISSPTDSHGSKSPVDDLNEIGIPSIYSLQSPGIDRPAISGPVAGGPIQNVNAWGNKSAPPREKRNIFGFKSKSPEENNPNQQRDFRNGASTPRLLSGRPVFGMPLNEAVQLFPPAGVDICLPAVVYRCIEYLEARDAIHQVGIFRESGSVLTIESLQERFNVEGDVNLLEGEAYENHAVATLLKRYMRDLPESILTRELHIDFLKVLETRKHGETIAAINILTHRLPEANLELLATLSRYLLEVVKHADVNLMTEKNIAICVAQSINIPIPLFMLFMTDHAAIFDEPIPTFVPSVIKEIDAARASSNAAGRDELRSPRKQLFTDLATPLHNQSSFGPDVYHNLSHQVQNVSSSGVSYRPIAVPPPQFYDPSAAQGFGSLNAVLAPPASAPSSTSLPESTKDIKKSRRESGIRGLVISSPLQSPGVERRKSSTGRVDDIPE